MQNFVGWRCKSHGDVVAKTIESFIRAHSDLKWKWWTMDSERIGQLTLEGGRMRLEDVYPRESKTSVWPSKLAA